MPGPTERNQCGSVTIFPMYVACNAKKPSSATASDGVASLYITGGTPPYSIQWNGGLGVSQSIYNLSVGTYTATVTDSNGDFTIVSNCVLSVTTTTTSSTTTSTTLPPCNDLCLVITTVRANAGWDYFYNRS